MAVEIVGKIIQKFDKIEGVSKTDKPWSKQDILLETQENFPRKVLITAFSEKISEIANFKVNDEVIASVNIESREFGGKWYTNINVWRMQYKNNGTGSNGHAASAAGDETSFYSDEQDSDVLPF